MKLTLKPSLLKRFNTPETLVVISSFPKRSEEVAKDNAVSRYSHLLFSHFPKNTSVVNLCEKSETISNEPYLLNKNVLIVPTFTKRSKRLFQQLHKQLSVLDQISNVHLQFEFSIYGSIPVSMGFVPFLQLLKMQGKYLTVTLHQVVSDINEMAPHVGLTKNSINTKTINTGLNLFYRSLLTVSDKVIVHDELLKSKLSLFGSVEKIAVIPHGVKPERTITHKERLQARKNLHITTQEKVILAYGYKSWYKGTDWLAQQIHQLTSTSNKNQYRLVLAGDYSPTQYNNPKYQQFIQKLEKIVSHSKYITSLGFVPEKEVRSIFAAADVVIFPYRARMSASGALSLAWQYQKPFLLSSYSAENLNADDVRTLVIKSGLDTKKIAFSLKSTAFSASLKHVLNSKKVQRSMKTLGHQITTERSWKKMGIKYSMTLIGSKPSKRSLTQEFTRLTENTREFISLATKPLLNFAQSYR